MRCYSLENKFLKKNTFLQITTYQAGDSGPGDVIYFSARLL